MKRQWKRICAIILAAVMILQYLPQKATVSAGESTSTTENTVPAIGNHVNLARSAKVLPTGFNPDASTGQRVQEMDLGAAEVQGDVWYFSGKFTYTQYAEGGTGGLAFIFGKYTKDNATNKLSVQARPYGVQNGTPEGTNYNISTKIVNDTLSGYISKGTIGGVQDWTQSVKYALNTSYTFTVKVDGTKLSMWIDEKAWYTDIDLSSVIGNDMQPLFGFHSDGTTGTISDIQIWDEIQTNLVAETDIIPTEFATGALSYQDLQMGTITPTKENYTYYFTGTFKYTQYPTGDNPGGLTFCVGEISHETKTASNLTVTSRMYPISTGGPYGACYLVGTTGTSDYIYQDWISETKYTTDVEYRWTVKVESSGRLELWIDNQNWTDIVTGRKSEYVDAGDFGSKGYSLDTIKFGLYADGTAGTVSDIQIWGDIETAPTIGDNENFADGRTMPTEFKAAEVLDLGKLKVSDDVETPTWYYSGKITYNEMGSYMGFAATYAKGTKNGTVYDLSVTARPVLTDGTVKETQYVAWYNGTESALAVGGNKVYLYQANQEYTFTVKVSGNKMSYWINNTLWFAELDLSTYGVTDITPYFGFYPDGANGTISDIKVWGDLERVTPATKGDDMANLLADAGTITGFTAGTNQYYDNEKVTVQGENWYYSGTFHYSNLKETFNGLTFVFGTGTYAGDKATVKGMRELSVTARRGGVGEVQTVLWADDIAVHAGGASGMSVETGEDYKWTIEVTGDNFTFWIDNRIIYDIKLSDYGITDVQPKFGLKPDGSTGTVSNVQVWDDYTKDVLPVFAATDTNQATFAELQTTAQTGRMTFDNMTFTGDWAYMASVSEASSSLRLLLGTAGDDTVEVYYDGTTAYLVKHGASDTTLSSTAITIEGTQGYSYKVKVTDSRISFWVNNTLAVQDFEVSEFKSAAGIVGTTAGTISDITIWGDVTKDENAVQYQKFGDISSYRGETKTYPQANGYVFGGWYQSAAETTAVDENTTSGSAYAKLVPEDVLTVKAQTNQNTQYDSADATRLRFVSTVDSVRYNSISFRITFRGKEKTLEDTYIYTCIQVDTAEAAITYAPTYFHDESYAFFTCSVTGIGKEYFNEGFDVIPCWTTLDGTMVKGVARNIAVNDNKNQRVTEAELGLGGSTLWQLGTVTTDVTKGNQKMAYIMEAYVSDTEKKVIVIDGGLETDADYLYWMLTTQYNGHVDAWYLSHEHGDHYGALKKMLEDGKIGAGEGKISIDHLYYNFPTNVTRSENEEGQRIIDAIANSSYLQESGRTVSAMAEGTEHTYGRVKIITLNDCNDYLGTGNNGKNVWGTGNIYAAGTGVDYNNASTLLLVQFYSDDACTTLAKQVLFLGDMGKMGEAYAMKQALEVAANKNLTLTGLVVQMAHHGNSGVSKAFYDMLEPSACLWPSTAWLMEKLPHDGKDAWENQELLSFLTSKGCTAHYAADYGNYKFK